MHYSTEDLFEIASNFDFTEAIYSIEKYGSGLINDTFLVSTKPADAQNYILQRINKHVFKCIEELTSNKVLISNILFENIKNGRKIPRFLPTRNMTYYLKDNNDEYWNLSHFIENSHIYHKVESPQIAHEAGKILGEFHQVVHNLPHDRVHTTIDNFHNLNFRLEQFEAALHNDSNNRVNSAKTEIDTLKALQTQMMHIPGLISSGQLPIRIIHNDTKINNILFDNNNNGICMIDLDTVMAGPVVCDYGDAIRSGVNTGNEDDQNLQKIKLNFDLFESFTRAYLSKACLFLEEIEVKTLVQGILNITYEQSLRFITDFLEGDKYYKIDYDHHNLVRTKAQLHLLKQFINNKARMEKFVLETLNTLENG